jgi:hypothetical protein
MSAFRVRQFQRFREFLSKHSSPDSESTIQKEFSEDPNFKFPKDFLDTADADAVKKVVDAVLIPQSEAQAADTKTVDLGQTPDQVKSAL